MVRMANVWLLVSLACGCAMGLPDDEGDSSQQGDAALERDARSDGAGAWTGDSLVDGGRADATTSTAESSVDVSPWRPDVVAASDAVTPVSPRDSAVLGHIETDAGARDTGIHFTLRSPPSVPTYSHGACPMLVSGMTAARANNTNFHTGSQRRDFLVIVPPSHDGSARWPVVFAWHWLNASARAFLRDGDLALAAETMHFIAVLPDARRDASGRLVYERTWPFVDLDGGGPGELEFFDDMLACVNAQFRVDHRRIYGVGASAGALWLTCLSTTPHVRHLAAIETISGGLAELGPWQMDYRPQLNKFPALILWGGPSDRLIVDFDRASHAAWRSIMIVIAIRRMCAVLLVGIAAVGCAFSAERPDGSRDKRVAANDRVYDTGDAQARR